MMQRQKPGRATFCAIISAFLFLTACVPVPRLSPGITDEQLAPIEAGKTTRTEVEEILGSPSIIWETERVWVYEQGPSGAFLWIIPAGYDAAIFLTELGEDVVIMSFDLDWKVERLDRRVGPLSRQYYGDFLRDWLAEERTEVDSSELIPGISLER